MKIPEHQAFTVAWDGRVNVIATEVTVSQVQEPDPVKILRTHAIWDTGATNSVITKSLATHLDLKPVDRVEVTGVHGAQVVNVYYIDLFLPMKVKIVGVRVTECIDMPNTGCTMLIGMDVIAHGDMAVSNFDGKTCFSFRVPSKKKIDFAAIINAENAQRAAIETKKEKSSQQHRRKKRR